MALDHAMRFDVQPEHWDEQNQSQCTGKSCHHAKHVQVCSKTSYERVKERKHKHSAGQKVDFCFVHDDLVTCQITHTGVSVQCYEHQHGT